jgi:hypothetical protein
MNRPLFALALSEGVRVTYSLSFDEALALLDSPEMISGDVVGDAPTSTVHWSSCARQLINDAEIGPSVEFVVTVTDGFFEDGVLVYVRKVTPPLNWEVVDTEVIEELERFHQKAVRRSP